MPKWESIFNALHENGWSLGWVSYVNDQKQLICLSDAHKAGFHIKAESEDLNEAFTNLANTLEAIKN